MRNKQKKRETVIVCCSSLFTLLGTMSFIIGLDNLFELSITLTCIAYAALGLHYYTVSLKGFK